MSNKLYNKFILIGILVLLIGIGIIPAFAGNNNSQEISSLTFYTFDRTGTRKCKVELPTVVVEDISFLFEELKNKITSDPFSDETKFLKNDFVEILDANGFITQGLSKDDVFSLLNPRWLQRIGNNNPFAKVNIPHSKISTFVDNFIPGPFSHSGSAFFCSMAGGGSGMLFPPIMLPRPRLVTVWVAYLDAVSIASNLYTGYGFAAGGPQFGMALGFWGVGLSFAYPGEPAVFGFGGYALAASVMAEYVEHYPPNRVPIISEENPSDGVWDVPVSLSELSFRISDADGDRMSYSVTTVPDIGGGSDSGVGDGVYSVPVSGLEFDKMYSWTVRVSDGTETVEKKFGFITEVGPPFDPFGEGWFYRKQITINHSQVAGDLSDFPVLISLTDVDLRDKAQIDGDDILFMDGSGVANRLFHEIELFNGSTGELVCWVNVPSLLSGGDSVLYLYYGNSDCDSQQYPERIWDSDFIHVWHLGDSLFDSAGFDDGNNRGTSIVSGKIGEARDFERDEKDYIDFGDMLQPGDSSLTTISWEGWVKPELQDIILITKYDTSGSDYVSYHLDFRQGGKFGIWSASAWGVTTQGMTDNSYSNIGEWIYLTATFELGGKNDLNSFINGNEVDFTQTTNSANVMNNIPVTDELGRCRYETSTVYTDGIFDEIRWSKVLRSNDWIKTSYNTMKDPSSFYGVGPEESYQ